MAALRMLLHPPTAENARPKTSWQIARAVHNLRRLSTLAYRSAMMRQRPPPAADEPAAPLLQCGIRML